MDLGIKGKKAIVCASSKGLGFGCALSLAEAGVDLIINSRNLQNLESAANLLKSKFQVRVETVAADITTKEGQDAVIEKAENNLDILVTNAGGPPPGVWSDWDRSDFISALDANMLTIEIILLWFHRSCWDLLNDIKFFEMVNILASKKFM